MKKNYQLEYAKKQQGKNKYAYYDNHRTVKQNIVILSGILKKAMAMRQEEITILSDRGKICPERLWKIGRSRDAKLFSQICPADGSTFVVDVLIDASGSQRVRQEQVALQAYIIMQALSSVHIPHRVMSFCTFWDHTILRDTGNMMKMHRQMKRFLILPHLPITGMDWPSGQLLWASLNGKRSVRL